jgi:hypothetical protein
MTYEPLQTTNGSKAAGQQSTSDEIGSENGPGQYTPYSLDIYKADPTNRCSTYKAKRTKSPTHL